jgi:hypothetical protein
VVSKIDVVNQRHIENERQTRARYGRATSVSQQLV